MKPSTNEVVAVVGASARAAAFSLLRQGYQVVTADLFADADLCRVCPAERINSYPQGFLPWLQQTTCDKWLYTGRLENNPDLVDELARIKPLWGNTGEVLRRIRDPLLLQTVLNQAGFLFPETVSTEKGIPIDGKWLPKSGTTDNNCSIPTSTQAQYYQRYVPGNSLAAVYLDQELMGVTQQFVGEGWTGASEYQYCGSIGPFDLPATMAQHLEKLGEHLSQEFGLQGWYGVDLILNNNELWIIEVNPRYTASMEVVEQFSENRRGYYGKSILFAKERTLIDGQVHQSLLQQAGPLTFPKFADVPHAGTQIETGDPVLTIFSEGRSIETVLTSLQQQTTALRQQLASKSTPGAAPCAWES